MPFGADAFFRALADETRLRCLALLGQGELCVCDLTAVLELAQPKISRHLAYLREAGLVVDRRQGRWIHYRLSPDLPDWAREVIETAVAGLHAGPPFAEDLLRLASLSARAERCGV
jgi:ArsR family transcriptional regulator